MAVVRNHDQRAGIVEQGVLERVPHVEIKMIGRLVEQQQVRPAINHQRQRQACLFATGERRSEEHTSELQSLMRNSYAVFCLKKKKTANNIRHIHSNSSAS